MDDKEIRQWCMIMHLSQFASYLVPLAGVIVPIVMWQLKKDESPIIDEHGRMVTNAIISYVIYTIVAALLCLVIIGFLILPVVLICAIVFPIIGAVKANDGELWRYPFVISFV